MENKNRIKLSECIMGMMRLATWKKRTDYRLVRAHKTINPHVYWYTHQSWELSIYCEHNDHGEYYLEMSASPNELNPEFYFVFLRNGRNGGTFLHLRHCTYFDELQNIVQALTGMELCINDVLAKQYLDEKFPDQTD